MEIKLKIPSAPKVRLPKFTMGVNDKNLNVDTQKIADKTGEYVGKAANTTGSFLGNIGARLSAAGKALTQNPE